MFAELIARTTALPWRPRGEAFASLVRAVVGQQISVKAASSVWGKLLTCCAASAEHPPSAATLRDLSPEDLRGCGLSQRKAEYVHALADHFLAPGFSIEALCARDDAGIIAELEGIRGIGRWTAEMFLMFHLHRPDVLPVGDLGLRAAVGSLYGDGGAWSAAATRAHAAPWRPYATAATWLLWRYLEADEPVRQAIRACRADLALAGERSAT